MSDASRPQPPSRSLAVPFLLSVLSLAALWGAALYRETEVLRPWKALQERYHEQRLDSLRKELRSVQAGLESPPGRARRSKAQAVLAAAERRAAAGPFHAELEALRRQLKREERELGRAQKRLQILRSQEQELEYRLSRSPDAGARGRLEALRQSSREAQREMEEWSARRQASAERLAVLRGPVEEARGELSALSARVEALTGALLSLAAEPIEVRQVLVGETGRVDRCISCHLATDDSRPAGEGQPFTAHPGAEIYLKHHPPERFGCTLCHQGQGLALSSSAKAHGEIPFWTEPLLRGEWAQASCQRCHEDARGLRGAPRLGRGIVLLEKYGCFGCHKIAGYENRPKIGPPLSRVASKVSYAWVVRWLRDPRRTQESSRMPNFRFGGAEAEAVADYLFSLSGDVRSDEAALQPRWDLLEQGRALFGQARCSLCHAAGGRGGAFPGAFAPDLSVAGSKLRRAWLTAWLENPRSDHPLSRMPRFRFTAGQREALAEFVLGEWVDAEIEAEKRRDPEPLRRESVELGRRLVEEYGCGGCHEIRGLERVEKIGPILKVISPQDKVGAELTTIGSKPLELFDFGRTEIPRTRKDYLLTKLESPRIFREGLRMPDFQLATDEREALVTLLLGFSSREMPRSLVAPRPAADFSPGGAAGSLIRDLQCLTCHRVRGVGGQYAPDLSFEGSRAQRDWIQSFLLAPDPIRPLLQQMPRFNLGADEAKILAEFIGVSLRDPRLEEGAPAGGGDAQNGARLYRERGCGLCHQIGVRGGTVGPELTHVGRRLEGAYLRQHLLDPRLSRREGPEPRYRWSEAELKDITAYLLSTHPEVD